LLLPISVGYIEMLLRAVVRIMVPLPRHVHTWRDARD
jgi:hypothetical protein